MSHGSVRSFFFLLSNESNRKKKEKSEKNEPFLDNILNRKEWFEIGLLLSGTNDLKERSLSTEIEKPGTTHCTDH